MRDKSEKRGIVEEGEEREKRDGWPERERESWGILVFRKTFHSGSFLNRLCLS